LVGGIQRSQVHFDFICAASENGRTAAGAEKPPCIASCFAIDRHRILWEYGGRMEKRPMMLAAVEAMTNADPVWLSRCRNSNVAAQATAGESVHAASYKNRAEGVTGVTLLALSDGFEAKIAELRIVSAALT
jgi:hypothetical protein